MNCKYCHGDKFCANPEAALMFARETAALSLSCRLSEFMIARGLAREELAKKAGLLPETVFGILEGAEWVPGVTVAMVAKLFQALDLVVEFRVKPLPGKTMPKTAMQVFDDVWGALKRNPHDPQWVDVTHYQDIYAKFPGDMIDKQKIEEFIRAELAKLDGETK